MEEEQDKVANLCFMALEDDIEVCLKSTRIINKWYLDSGYSRHMTGDKEQFNKLDAKDGGHVTFGDNAKGKIIAIGEISNP